MSFLLLSSGDGTVSDVVTTRAQLPLLLAQATNLTTVPIGQASETDTALPITVALAGGAVIQVGQASETDTALPVIAVIPPNEIFVPVGLVEETDTALAVTVTTSGAAFIPIGVATETDEALPITFSRSFLSVTQNGSISITPTDDAHISITPVEVE